MKRTTLLLALTILSMTGCSKTWSGIKQDTNELINSTRNAIHEATAPTHTPTITPPTTETIAPLPNVTQTIETPKVTGTIETPKVTQPIKEKKQLSVEIPIVS